VPLLWNTMSRTTDDTRHIDAAALLGSAWHATVAIIRGGLNVLWRPGSTCHSLHATVAATDSLILPPSI